MATQINGATQIRSATVPWAAMVTGAIVPTASLVDGAKFIKSDGTVSMTSSLAMGANTITGLGAGVNSTDAVNLGQVQALVAGLSDRAEVQYAATSALPANTYANGASGVGATLTGTATGTLSIDGVSVAVGQRVLIAGEATAANNGIYTVTTNGAGVNYVLTRATDMNSATTFGTGILVPVKVATGNTAGTANDGKVFMSAAASAFTVGTTAISFATIGSAYTNGTGLSLTGNTFSVNYGTTATTAAAGNDARITGALQTSALGANVQTALGIAVGSAGAVVLNGGVLGTPSSGTLTSCTGLPVASGISGLGTGVATALGIAAGTGAGFALLSNGFLTAAEFPALTGDVTTVAGALATTVNSTPGTGFLKYGRIINNEVPTGTLNGSNVTFNLVNAPQNGAVSLYLNGMKQQPGAGKDYTIAGAVITMLSAPGSTDLLLADYTY